MTSKTFGDSSLALQRVHADGGSIILHSAYVGNEEPKIILELEIPGENEPVLELTTSQAETLIRRLQYGLECLKLNYD